MAMKGNSDGSWYVITSKTIKNSEKSKYLVAEIWDSDEIFCIDIEGNSYWFDKEELKSIMKEILDIKR